MIYLKIKLENTSGSRSIKRIINDFQNDYKLAINVFDLDRIINRLTREANLLGNDKNKLKEILDNMKNKLDSIRSSNNPIIDGDSFNVWADYLEKIRRNPVAPDLDNSLM